MGREETIQISLDLINASKTALVGSIGSEGYPNIKSMFKMQTEGIHKIWFSTNASSRRVSQFKSNPKSCVYFVDPDQFIGLMLVGDIEILDDFESKQRLWREGFEKYYPLGVADPDYCVLQFTAKWGNYYHGLQNINFEI